MPSPLIFVGHYPAVWVGGMGWENGRSNENTKSYYQKK